MREPVRLLLAQSTLAFLLLSPLIPFTRADGGTVRFSERQGGYQITVFTAPTPLRAGLVDFSVLLQDAATGAPLLDACIEIAVAPSGRPQEIVRSRASAEAATNKLFQAATFELPTAGRWQVEVQIDGPRGPARVKLEVEAAEPQPRWEEMAFWIALPVVPILLFGIHQVLVRPGRPHPPV